MFRPSKLDEHMKANKSSSLYSSNPSASKVAIGCHLYLRRHENCEIGRLIYSGEKSQKFPEDDELVAFWYDERHLVYEQDITSDPIIEDL